MEAWHITYIWHTTSEFIISTGCPVRLFSWLERWLPERVQNKHWALHVQQPGSVLQHDTIFKQPNIEWGLYRHAWISASVSIIFTTKSIYNTGFNHTECNNNGMFFFLSTVATLFSEVLGKLLEKFNHLLFTLLSLAPTYLLINPKLHIHFPYSVFNM